MAEEWFKLCKNLDESRTLYRELLMKYHPDRVPPSEKEQAEETFKEVTAQFEDFLKRVPTDQFTKSHERRKGSEYQAAHPVQYHKNFYEVLAQVMAMNVDVEVIGAWIHVTNANGKGYIFKLTALGFWYSSHHDALIWTGDEKKRVPPQFSTDGLRSRFGAEKKRDKRYM